MKGSNGYAEQCKDWSDEDTACFDRHIAQAARHDWHATTNFYPPAYPGLLDYAVHALWQTALSLCNGTRAWTQILSVGEQRGTTTHTHLCSAHYGGAGAGAVGPVAGVSRTRSGAVRHRLRIAPASRRQITGSDGVGQLVRGGVCDRYNSRQSTRGQHVGSRRARFALALTISRGGTSCARR
jgi:hypothetical protein